MLFWLASDIIFSARVNCSFAVAWTLSSEMESFIEAMVGNFSEGKSGSFVVFSADKQYILKTLSRKEQRQLLRMLPRFPYHQNRDKCRFAGMYYHEDSVRKWLAGLLAWVAWWDSERVYE